MFDYKTYVDKYCIDYHLDLNLSFDMPSGYETANGTFDVETKTVFINEKCRIEALGVKTSEGGINLAKYDILPHRKA